MTFKPVSPLFLFLIFLGLCISTALSDSQLSFFPVSSYQTFEDTRQALKEAHIIPDTLNDFLPSCHLRLFYTSSQEEVWLGNKITPSHTKKPPSVRIVCPNAEDKRDGNGFTVVLTDPDAPSRKNPKWSEMCHWIAIVENYHELKGVVEYKPPGPPSKTGYHRYVFVLLQGDNTNLTAPAEREHWGTGQKRHGVRDWAAQERLEVVGANFFFAKDKKQ